MIGVLTTHHCHNGLLPLLVAPSQDAELPWLRTSSFPLCPSHRPGPTLMRASREAESIRPLMTSLKPLRIEVAD